MRDVLHIRDWANRRYCEVARNGAVELLECEPMEVPLVGDPLERGINGRVRVQRVNSLNYGHCWHVYPEGTTEQQAIEEFKAHGGVKRVQDASFGLTVSHFNGLF